MGLPREIVKVCDLARLRAFSQQRRTVSTADITAVSQELHLIKE